MSMSSYEEKIGHLEKGLSEAQMTIGRQIATIERQSLELQAAALLLASARSSSGEDASHICRREFRAIAERFLEIETEARGV